MIAKILLLYTSFRQVEEIGIQAVFIENGSFVKERADVLLACNNMALASDTLWRELSKIPVRNRHLVQEDWNCGGYARGQFEVLHQLEATLRGYDLVIHLHPDIFIADDRALRYLADRCITTRTALYVGKIFGDLDPSFGTDFFAFRPQFLPRSFFRWYVDYDQSISTPLERVFYQMVKKAGVPYEIVNRFERGFYYRDIDLMGLWHDHDIQRVRAYIKHPSLRHLRTVRHCLLRNRRLALAIMWHFIRRKLRREAQEPLLKQLSAA